MSKKQQQFTIFTPKLHLECVHLIKQLMTFHFGGHWFINPLEVMFTSAVGFGEHHFLGVDTQGLAVIFSHHQVCILFNTYLVMWKYNCEPLWVSKSQCPPYEKSLIVYYYMTMNFLNSDSLRRLIASSNRSTCPPRNFAREVNKSHAAVSMYPNIVTGENQ